MNKLETELGRFEIEFGVKSANFHAAMINGELDEFDALDEYRMEFIGWLALYETWQSLDQKYSPRSLRASQSRCKSRPIWSQFMPDPLASPDSYQTFIYSLPARYYSIHRSTLVYIASGALFGRVEGILLFSPNLVLCVQEFLNFELQIIAGYGYEVSRSLHAHDAGNLPLASDYCRASYPHKEKLYWCDSFPHPHLPHPASTHPHHKHTLPDIKHHRIPAPGLSFTRPKWKVCWRTCSRWLTGLSGKRHRHLCLRPRTEYPPMNPSHSPGK